MDLDRQGGAASPAADADDEAEICGSLFSGLLFFLGREVPREQLLLVIRAFGGSVAWNGDGSPTTENDEAITHQVGHILGRAARKGMISSSHDSSV